MPAEDHQRNPQLLAALVEELARRLVVDVVLRRVGLQQARFVGLRELVHAAHDGDGVDLFHEEHHVVPHEERSVFEGRNADQVERLGLRVDEYSVEKPPAREQAARTLLVLVGDVTLRRLAEGFSVHGGAAVGAHPHRHAPQAERVQRAAHQPRPRQRRLEVHHHALAIQELFVDEVAQHYHGHLVVQVLPGVGDYDAGDRLLENVSHILQAQCGAGRWWRLLLPPGGIPLGISFRFIF